MAQGAASPLNRLILMKSLTLDSPAKVNLMLSVHGQRGDGFHALTSLVVALDFGDTIRVSINDGGCDQLRCSDPRVPTGEANLIVKAAAAFRLHSGRSVSFDFDLEKRIPMGAGLGGGSSNAAVALRAMNELTRSPFSREQLLSVAAELGSDCPFFIDAVPTMMTGRGEVLEPLSGDLSGHLRGQRIILFRPDFGINTAWAYGRLIKSSPSAYELEAAALARFSEYTTSLKLERLLFNTFEPAVGGKYMAIPCLLDQLRSEGIACLMSGSGSCCFALANDEAEAAVIRSTCQSAWGSGIFFVETLTL